MSFFIKKEPPRIPYDPDTQQPAVRTSICTGEMTVGLVEQATGKFREYELARSQSDIDSFCKRIGAAPEDVKQIY